MAIAEIEVNYLEFNAEALRLINESRRIRLEKDLDEIVEQHIFKLSKMCLVCQCANCINEGTTMSKWYFYDKTSIIDDQV